MANIQQWWLVSYGDNFEQRWVFEVRSDADALALATGGKVDPVPATMAQLVSQAAGPCEHPLYSRTLLRPGRDYIYSCGKCHSIVCGP